MIIRILLLGMLLTTAISAGANEKIYLRFELVKGTKVIERGTAYVQPKPHTWSKGLKSSYLRLRCHQPDPEHVQKLYSTVDHFAGLRVTKKKLVGDKIELTVVHSVVQARLKEIRALARDECKDLSPVVTTTTETYLFSSKDGSTESRPFGEGMTFRATIHSVGG